MLEKEDPVKSPKENYCTEVEKNLVRIIVVFLNVTKVEQKSLFIIKQYCSFYPGFIHKEK